MTTHIGARKGSWLDGLRRLFAGLFHRSHDERRGAVETHRQHDHVPTPTEEEVDQSLEDSFPASDPPSYSGTSIG